MNEELQKRLVESWDKIIQYLEHTENFVAEQAPLVVQEIINWGIWSNIVLLLIWFIISIILLKIGNYLFGKGKYCLENNISYIGRDDQFGLYLLGTVVYCGSMVSFFAGCGTSIYNLFYVLCAPRLYVLDQISNLW